MAGEINRTLQFTCSKGGASIAATSVQKQSDMTGDDVFTQTQSIPTSGYTALDVGSVTFPAHLMIQNIDSTNNVAVYRDNAGAQLMSTLHPGEFCYLNRVGAAPYLQAAVAAVIVFSKGCEV